MRKNLLRILAAILLSSSTWIWIQAIAIPKQQSDSAARSVPRGNLSDLYPRWLGARELLLRHRDPYSWEVTREIQAGYYGRPLDPNHPDDPKDQQAFAYPLYVAWILGPTVRMPFWLAQRTIFGLLILMTGSSVFLWFDVLRWQLPVDRKIAWLLLTMSCLPTIQGLKLQQLTLLVAAVVAGSWAALARERLMLAGVLLALATIKPQLAFLLVLWLAIWVSGDWPNRRRLFWSFGITMAALIGTSELLLPGWIGEFKKAMDAYYQYTGGGTSLLDSIFTTLWGRIVALAVIAVLVFVHWNMREKPASSPEFAYSLSLTLATTLLVIPMFAPYNQVLLLPAVMVLMRFEFDCKDRSLLPRFVFWIVDAAVFWPFITAAITVILLFASVPRTILQRGALVPLYTTLAIPVSVYIALLVLKRQFISRECPDQHVQVEGAHSSGSGIY